MPDDYVDQAKAINQQSLIAWQDSLQTAYKEVRDALVSLREYGEEKFASKIAREVVRRRGIYLLPNLLTTGALCAGFYAILSAMSGRFASAAIAIFVAMIFDGLDGRVARLTNTQSAFGVQYDSLSDMVSFGVAPAVVSYAWMLHALGKLGWAALIMLVSSLVLPRHIFGGDLVDADTAAIDRIQPARRRPRSGTFPKGRTPSGKGLHPG